MSFKSWKEQFVDLCIDTFRINDFYNKDGIFPDVITLPITHKFFMCEFGGLNKNGIGTSFIIGTANGACPSSNVIFRAPSNGAQATIKVKPNSFIGIGTRVKDNLRISIYRVVDIHVKNKNNLIRNDELFGTATCKLYYSIYQKYGEHPDTDTSLELFRHFPNLEYFKHNIVDKLYITNCRIPCYVEHLVKINDKELESRLNNCTNLVSDNSVIHAYSSDQYSDFYIELIDQLLKLRSSFSDIFCEIKTYKEDYRIFSEVIIYGIERKTSELFVCPETFMYEHSILTPEELNNRDQDRFKNHPVMKYMRHFSYHYFSTMFGYDSIFDFMNQMNSDNPGATVNIVRYYLT